MINTIKSWLPLALAITVLSGLVYVAVQQNYRMSANDPQIQLAEDFAVGIANNQQPPLPKNIIDIAQSLSLFAMILDENGRTLYSSAFLDGKAVLPPKGVLDYAQVHGEDRVTWQPKTGVRAAIVVVPAYNQTTKKSGYVIIGRSLREVESRINNLTKMTVAGWLAGLALTLGSQIALSKKIQLKPENV